jgi:hypothetical protein
VGCCHQRWRTHREREENIIANYGALTREQATTNKLQNVEDEGRVLQVSYGIPYEWSKQEIISRGETVQDWWQLTLLWLALLQKVIFGENESLGQNQRHHESDSDQTFEFGSVCNNTWLVISDLSTSKWSPIANSVETRQEGFVPPRKDIECEEGQWLVNEEQTWKVRWPSQDTMDETKIKRVERRQIQGSHEVSYCGKDNSRDENVGWLLGRASMLVWVTWLRAWTQRYS